MKDRTFTIGAVQDGEGQYCFSVWAPETERVDLHLLAPDERLVPLTKNQHGYHSAVLDGVPPGSDYRFRLDGEKELPDPASRWQPAGVHGPSRIVESHFNWSDNAWFGLPLRDYIIYELHVGTFSGDGTFDGVIKRLGQLKELGVTAIEIMPVAQFPGSRNWGYDGVYPFAVQDSYGGPEGLKRLVNEAHRHGLAVILDVVYNHLGPEGNYLREYGAYFTSRYHTPWGDALNFDGAESDHVRRYFMENALYWQTEFHVDALRLDAVHAIRDFSPVPFLQELATATHRQAETLNRRFYLIAESDLNMARHILPTELGGYGLDAQWSDDFHHTLRVLLSGDRSGYYADYDGLEMMAKVWREGYAYTGQYSRHRRHRHGTSPKLNSVKQFVVCRQNHDQIGNRMLGDRLNNLTVFESLKVGAGAVLLSPFIPLLFMGEEYAETAPFLYFVSHSDPELVEAVRKGRSEEFSSFKWQGEVPDPQAVATFERSKLNHERLVDPHHATLHEFYRELIALRKTLPAIGLVEKDTMDVRGFDRKRLLYCRQWHGTDEIILLLNFNSNPVEVELPIPEALWRKRLDSAESRWKGPGSDLGSSLNSDGEASLRLQKNSIVLFQKS